MKLTLIYCSHLILRSHCFDGCSNNIPYDILSVFLSLGTCLFLIYIIMCTYVLSFNLTINTFSSVQSLCHVRLFATPGTTALQVSLSFTNSQSLPRLMSIELVMPFNHLILCYPLLLLPSNFPNIMVFSNESALRISWPKYWSFSFNISPSNKHSRLISFRMDWLDLLAVQGTLKSLLQCHSSKASILWHSGSLFTLGQLSFLFLYICLVHGSSPRWMSKFLLR